MSEFFRLHPASIAAMAEFTLSFLIVVYFLSIRDKTRDTWLMVGYVGLAMLTYLVDIGATSSRPPVYVYFRISHTILISAFTLFGTWCAYTYRSYPLRREGVIIMIIEVLLTGGIIIDSIVKYKADGNVFIFFSVGYALVGLSAWSAFVLLRRSRIAANHRDNSQATMLTNLNLVLRPAQSMRAFALLFASPVIFFFAQLIFYTPLCFHISNMVLLLGVLVLHLNYANEATTFQVKLVSLPVATTLALLGVLPFLLFGGAPPEAMWYTTDEKLQQQLSIFVWLIPCFSVFILVAFVFFYWVGLIRPLGKLMDGVRRIEEGDLTTQVPVFTTDEIGHFAHGLNTMATSLKASYDELENRVAERTEQLQSSLMRLQATQTQLIHQEKMASLGELTAGIAHEIQNPLNFVNNFSEVNKEMIAEMKEEIDKGNYEEVKLIADDIKENEEKINHHGKRADAIVKGMLQHSKTSTGVKEPTDINKLAEEYVRLAWHGLRAKDKSFNADIKTDYDEAVGQINIVQQDIGRVLLNLYNNAFYAVNEKKKTADELYHPTVSVETNKLDGHVQIIVGDNGNGIAENIINKIFQPFFTTKPTGQGTGLGLSLAYEIIKAHGGEIKAQGREGEGSVFTVLLPVI